MIKKWLRILPIICLLIAQVIVAAHIHSPDEIIAEQECVFCQTAAEIAVIDTPEVLTVSEPISHKTAETTSFIQNVVYFNLSYNYETRAPPQA